MMLNQNSHRINKYYFALLEILSTFVAHCRKGGVLTYLA